MIMQLMNRAVIGAGITLALMGPAWATSVEPRIPPPPPPEPPEIQTEDSEEVAPEITTSETEAELRQDLADEVSEIYIPYDIVPLTVISDGDDDRETE